MTCEDERFNRDKLTDLTPFEHVSVLNLGGGAVGSYFSDLIAKRAVEHSTTVDIDRYEPDNLSKTSSLIREEDNGRWKAEALSERTQKVMKKGSRANAIVGSIENLGPMAFKEYDFVCSAPDNKAAREYVNQQLKMLPADIRPTFIVGGTDGEMATSAVFTDLDSACYRCMCEERSFRSSRKRTSCAEARYLFAAGKTKTHIRVSDLSSVKAAVMMADDLRAKVTDHLPVRNRNRVWNPDTLCSPIESDEIHHRTDCPDCAGIKPPREILPLHGNTMSTTLSGVFEQLSSVLGSDDFEIYVYKHIYGEDTFNEYVRHDYCRSCGEIFDVYLHTRFIDSADDLLCSECRNSGKRSYENVMKRYADIIYGFSPKETDSIVLNSTLYELGYTVGAYLTVINFNGAGHSDLSNPDIQERCFYMDQDSLMVKEQNINFMEAYNSGKR